MEQAPEEDFDLLALIEAHRRVAHSDELFDRFIECICLAQKLKKRIGELSDRRVAELLDAIVCDSLQAFQP